MSDLAAKDFHVASCQATLFTPEEAVSAVKLIKGLLPSWVSRFDQEPMVLPFGGEVPREIPRLILQSKDGARRCEIASERINLLWRKVSPDAPEPTLAEFYGDASLQLVEYQQFLGARVGRIAAVINRYAEVICRIGVKGIGTLEFDMSNERLEAIVNSGRCAMTEYLQKRKLRYE